MAEHSKKCEGCGEDFVASRRDAKYCSQKCREKGHRRRKVQDDFRKSLAAISLVDAVEREVQSLGHTDSVDALMAIGLARRIISPFETASAAVAAAKQLDVVMERLRAAKPVGDEVAGAEEAADAKLRLVSGG